MRLMELPNDETETTMIARQDRADTAPAAQSPVAAMAYFAGDATNPTVRLRIGSFLKRGVDVVGLTFRRDKFHQDFTPFWPNIALGTTRDRHYLRRFGTILLAFRTIWRERARLKKVEVLYARLFDVAFIAMVSRWLLGLDAKLVYEIEDVQAVFFRRGLTGSIFRFLERRVLAASSLVVVPSPGFVEGYLRPFQNYEGPTYLLENRIQLDEIPSAESSASTRWRDVQDRWVIGWFGTLRCRKSMQLLEEIAERLGDRVLIYTRGYPTETGIDAYMEIVNRHPNWVYDGPYTMPDDLEDLYGRVHFVWCLDFLDEGGNSELLLACRMYHGGYFGAAPLVSEKSQMARHLAPYGVGHQLSDEYVDDVCDLLGRLTWEEYVQERESLLALRDELFLEDGSGIIGVLNAIAAAPA
ncbi:MAG: hypothetical protein KDA53_04935 [Hyphomonas sp.]|nr:hypothetical protein [Hyphomonas sp.]